MPSPDTSSLDNVLVGPADDEIVGLEARIRTAQLSADLDELNALISEDLLFAGPDGQLGTKSQDLHAYSSGIVRFVKHEPQELRIRRSGQGIAVTSLLTDLAVLVNGVASGGRYRYTRIWERQPDGRWQVIGGHVSPVTGAPPQEVPGRREWGTIRQ